MKRKIPFKNYNKTKRLLFFYIIIILSFIAILIKLSYIKVVNTDEYYEKALNLWTRSVKSKGERGHIYDRNGKIIVSNKLTFNVVIIPKQIKDKAKTAKILSEILNTSVEEINKYINKTVSIEEIKPYGRNIDTSTAIFISKLGLPGVYCINNTKRDYINSFLLAPVIGIVGVDNQGITGLEYIYNEQLKGKTPILDIFTDAHGNKINDLTSYYEMSERGSDIYLTIDIRMQIVLENLTSSIVSAYNPKEVMMIAMNPKTSEIYGMISYPSFSLSDYQNYSSESYNRVLPLWKNFEPGSVFKIATFAAGIEENVFTLDEGFYDPGYMIIDGVKIRDWKKGGHGRETFLDVLANSCNPGFMTIGLRLGKERLFKYYKDFGFGEKTGIDLLGEAKGILFNIDNIGNVELATSSFGQGNAVTALQLVNACASIINGGYLNTPYILKKIVKDNKIVKENSVMFKRRVISEETSNKLRYALENVASSGTARSSYIEGYRVGGKTGTAQIAENGRYVDGKYILSFLGMAPMNDPKIMIYCAITEAKNTIQYGGVVCGPVVKEALMNSFSIFNIEKQDGGIPQTVRYYIDKNVYSVNNYIGKKKKEIIPTSKYNIVYEGVGDTVIDQVPSPNEVLIEGGYVILYLG